MLEAVIASVSAGTLSEDGVPWADALQLQREVVDARIVIYARTCAAATSAEGIRSLLKRDLKARTERLGRLKAAARTRTAAIRDGSDAALREGDTASAQDGFLQAANLEFPAGQRSAVRADELMIESLAGMLREAEGMCARFDAEVNEARSHLAEARHELDMIEADRRAADLIGAWLSTLGDGCLPQLGIGDADLARIPLVIGVSLAARRWLRLQRPQTFTVAELARHVSVAPHAFLAARCS